MYIRYRAINPNIDKEILEIAEMVGITRNPETGLVTLSLAGNYMDVYFKIDEVDYEELIEEICSSLQNNVHVYTIKSIGIMYDSNGYFKDSSTRLTKMNKLFEEMKFHNV